MELSCEVIMELSCHKHERITARHDYVLIVIIELSWNNPGQIMEYLWTYQCCGMALFWDCPAKNERKKVMATASANKVPLPMHEGPHGHKLTILLVRMQQSAHCATGAASHACNMAAHAIYSHYLG